MTDDGLMITVWFKDGEGWVDNPNVKAWKRTDTSLVVYRWKKRIIYSASPMKVETIEYDPEVVEYPLDAIRYIVFSDISKDDAHKLFEEYE